MAQPPRGIHYVAFDLNCVLPTYQNASCCTVCGTTCHRRLRLALHLQADLGK